MAASDALGIPRLRVPDSTLGFARDGYAFGERRFRRVRADAFRTRIALRPVTVVRGPDAARIFYEGDRFSRSRAMPTTVLHLLQDEGSVQTLEGAAHHHRKALFVRMLSDPVELARLRAFFVEEWAQAAASWPREVVLNDALAPLLTRVALRWVGIDPRLVDVPSLAGELSAMVENAGSLGPANWWAQRRRTSTERWAGQVVERARDGRLAVDAGTFVDRLARQTDVDGTLLPPDVAAVELLNVLRPTVAVARFVVFTAHALHTHASWRDDLVHADDAAVERFVQEVRRLYPFFPVIAGTVRRAFSWHGHDFGPGDWVMLDLYATNHDGRLWPDPHRFDPDRFRDWDGDPSTLVPQGAGDASTGHRCPGERATVELMTAALRILLADPGLEVPPQDLSISLRRFPALPRSGFVLRRPQR